MLQALSRLVIEMGLIVHCPHQNVTGFAALDRIPVLNTDLDIKQAAAVTLKLIQAPSDCCMGV